LKSLQKRGLIESTLESPTRFLAVPFETALDMFAKAKRDEAILIEESAKDLLNDWQKISKPILESSIEKFVVINGTRKIYHKISNMINETKSQLCSIITIHELLKAEQMCVFDNVFNNSLSSKIQFRFLTDVSNQNAKTIRTLWAKIPPTGVKVKGRNPELGLRLSPRMVIRDKQEIIFSITPKTDSKVQRQDDVFLWTNCQSIIQSFTSVFEELWRNATDIEDKIGKFGTIKPKIKTSTKNNVEQIKQKYDRIILSAKKEVIMMITSENLIDLWKNKTISEKLLEKNLSIKIMAPLTTMNLEVVKQLSKDIEVRHVPESLLETVVIDGKHLFQFKTPFHDQEKSRTEPKLIDGFYTNNLSHIKKITSSLDDIWKHARPPSSITLESIMESSGSIPNSSYPPLRKVKGLAVFINESSKLTENEILNKIKKTGDSTDNFFPEQYKMYSTTATAIIHPPKFFNLPDIMITIDHIQKQSRFGEGDALMVYVESEKSNGHLFESAGGIGTNPRGVEHRKKIQFSKLARDNYRFVKKDELQVRVSSNSLFAGWTVPISLFPKYVLPPASILIEGYGPVKTKSSTIIGSSGYKYEAESNYFDAFVTFMHPSSRYSGPGTDGLFFRDVIVTTTPPTNLLKNPKKLQ
jgi:sugar-specific transcriptional regulator TrmB